MFKKNLIILCFALVLNLLPAITRAQINLSSPTPNAEPEESPPEPEERPIEPAINSFSPDTLIPGYTSLTIFGQGFGDNYSPTLNQICFDQLCILPEDMSRQITEWTDAKITVTVPNFSSWKSTGQILVRTYIPALRRYSYLKSANFYLSQARPQIDRYYPTMETFSRYSWTGVNFGVNPGRVLINSVSAPVVSWSNSEITFEIPENAVSGSVVIEDSQGIPTIPISIAIKVLKKVSDDEYSYLQWYLELMNLPTAWEITTGSPDVIVAVIDGGVDFNHEDLKHSRWENSEEIADNDIDDDKNGFVDDRYGWDFINNRPDNYINDHGTAIASLIAAQKDNQLGLAGIAPNVKIMSLNIAIDQSSSRVDAVLKAIKYAVDNGAHIINLSFGSDYLSDIYEDVLEYAYDHNVLIIAAAGNENTNLDVSSRSPACNDAGKNLVIGVAAITPDNKKSEFSNFGSKCIDLIAPGEELVVAKPGQPANLYGKFGAGTSFATPIVVGLAALVKSLHPDWNVEEIKAALFENTIPLDDQNPAYRGQLGHGLINAYSLLQAPKPTVTYSPKPTSTITIAESNINIIMEPPVLTPIEEPVDLPTETAPIESVTTPNKPNETDSKPSLSTSESFPDTKNYKYKEAVDFIKTQNIVQGYADGRFRPNKQINRAEFTKIVINAFKIPTSGQNCFSDVKTEWFAPFVCAAKNQGIILGYPDGTFKPEQSINLVEALKIVILSAGVSPQSQAGDQWFDSYIRYAQQNSLNFANEIFLDQKITRGEMAQIAYWILTLRQ